MLKIIFGSHPDEIYNTEIFYQNQYDGNWITEPFARKIIEDIDDSQVIGSDLVKNDVFGTFGSVDLSGGVKTLLLIKNMPKKIFNISNCGDNCAKYLLEIASERDIKVCLHHTMKFDKGFSVQVINDRRRKIITDPIEYVMLAHHYLRGDANEG